MTSIWRPEERLVGESPSMAALSRLIDRVAASALPVLVQGETGTGKELVARAIHLRSARRDGPFVSESCATLSEGLLEAELFGHEQGAFTGADRARPGLFARAHGGTLLVDEVGEMPPAMQAMLLRVLQEHEVRPVGGQSPRAVDVRVVAATHRDLRALVRAGAFRADLLFRLAILEVQVPPLRDRLEDVPLLAAHALRALAAGGGPELRLTPAALDALLAHDWPGNVRELENAVRVAAVFSQGGALDAGALPLPERPALEPSVAPSGSYGALCDALTTHEREYVQAALQRARGNKAEAARSLGVSRYRLYRILRRLGLGDGGAGGLGLAAGPGGGADARRAAG